MTDSSFDLSRLIETVRPGLRERLGNKYDVDGLFGAGAGVGTGASAGTGAQIQLIRTPADDESFQIEVADARHARVVAGSRGLRYGLGRLLRESRYEPRNILFSPGLRESRPQRNLRGVYFATHFHNFYHAAPLEQIGQYIGELSLWGANALLAWLDLHHYASLDQAQAAGMVQRVRQILLHAQSHGMKPGLTMLANEAYSSSPPALRAQWRAGQNGYHAEPQGHYHVELCPSTPEGWSLLLAQREEMLDQFADLDLGFVVIWPYDQGGCTCAACAPWGGKGYLKLAQALARLVRHRWPGAKIILSTWYFDRFTSGEWDLLRDQRSQVRTWADQLMVGSLADSEMAVPADIRDFQFELVGFPEISMWGTGGYGPWCGFGAGPYPGRLQKHWEGGDHRVAGALSYSESLADDLSKVVCLNHLWGDIPACQSVREYAGYELSPAVAEEFATLIGLLESTLPRQRVGSGEQTQFIIQNPSGVQDACDLAISIDARLPASRRESWRWRQIFLRTIIDRELIGNDGRVNAMCNEAAMELRDLYCAANAASPVAPITLDSLVHPVPW